MNRKTSLIFIGCLVVLVNCWCASTALAQLGTPGRISPAIAYDPHNDRYLVVYSLFTDWGFDDYSDIWGRFIGSNGVPVGTEFVISTASYNRITPSLAYDDVNNRFLVVWADRRSGIVEQIYGQLINADGTMSGFNFPISDGVAAQTHPKVAFDTVNQKFLVVWEDNRNTGQEDLYVQVVKADGTLEGVNLLLAAGGLSISSRQPSIAFDSANQNFLIAWRFVVYLSAGNLYSIIGSFYNISSGLVTTTQVAWASNYSLSTPSVSYDSGNQNFLIVWRDNRAGTSNSDIYGQLVNSDGSLDSGEFIVINAQGNQSNPAAAYNSTIQKFLAVCEDFRSLTGQSDIYGQLLTTTGSLDGADFTVSAANGDQKYPALTSNSTDGSFLIAYQTSVETAPGTEHPDIAFAAVTYDSNFCPDLDGDGYVVLDGVCTIPAGKQEGDCNDNDANEHPGQTWYKDLDNDGYSDATAVVACSRPLGYKVGVELTSVSGDCNDSNGGVHPGATEIPNNGVDEDCDGVDADTIGPDIQLTLPSDGATNVALNTNIVVHVRDGGSGVANYTMTVEGVNVTSLVAVTGDSADYTLTYNPASDFANGQEVNITVTASDSVVPANTRTELFSFIAVAGAVSGCPNDDDCDGITNAQEAAMGTNPSVKTLFVRPLAWNAATGKFVFWSDFKAKMYSFPVGSADRPGFAYIPPLAAAGIEVSIVGDPAHPYAPMRGRSDYNPSLGEEPVYDPAKDDPNHYPCDILDVRYTAKRTAGSKNNSHTYFYQGLAGYTWTWDLKGYTQNISLSTPPNPHWNKYQHHQAFVYRDPLDYYMAEGAYPTIDNTYDPVQGLTTGLPGVVLGCTGPLCVECSPMNLLDTETGPPYTGHPDLKVDFNAIEFDSSAKITNVGARGTSSFDRWVVLARTILHEMGHALLTASGELPNQGDHCSQAGCIMSGSTINTWDWRVQSFGVGQCKHLTDAQYNIQEKGIIHNSTH